jgi:hypothetical protein
MWIGWDLNPKMRIWIPSDMIMELAENCRSAEAHIKVLQLRICYCISTTFSVRTSRMDSHVRNIAEMGEGRLKMHMPISGAI